MTAYSNIIKANDTVKALDIEFVKNFQQDYDRLVEIVGLFPSQTMTAGTALYQYKITGNLLDGSTSDGTSGTSYTEGDFIARSKYQVTKEQIGEIEFYPYAKQTTAQAILKGGFENAVGDVGASVDDLDAPVCVPACIVEYAGHLFSSVVSVCGYGNHNSCL